MTVYRCDCNRFDDVDPFTECPNGIDPIFHNLAGEEERRKFRKLKDTCELRIKAGKDEFHCLELQDECEHSLCPKIQPDYDKELP
jgi:hypothetical protein